MHLRQLDLARVVYLADGRECKLLTGIEDHSRFGMIATVLAVPSGRPVAEALSAAMRIYGVPAEVLTDNGKQPTGRFIRPRPRRGAVRAGMPRARHHRAADPPVLCPPRTRGDPALPNVNFGCAK
jgi:hypothetical protein